MKPTDARICLTCCWLKNEASWHASQSLTERERRILELRFGTNLSIPMTLENVGKEMGLSRERTRQLVARAIKKISIVDQGRDVWHRCHLGGITVPPHFEKSKVFSRSAT